MKIAEAFYEAIKNRRVLKWEIGSAALYALPAIARFVTRNPTIPILNAPYYSLSPFIPSNLVEKFLVNSFFPGGAGGVVGETLISKYKNESLKGRSKYLARMFGAYLQYSIWTAFQYAGYLTKTIGPHGENVFEGPEVYPFNLLLATLSIFTPDVIDYGMSKMKPFIKKVRSRVHSPSGP